VQKIPDVKDWVKLGYCGAGKPFCAGVDKTWILWCRKILMCRTGNHLYSKVHESHNGQYIVVQESPDKQERLPIAWPWLLWCRKALMSRTG